MSLSFQDLFPGEDDEPGDKQKSSQDFGKFPNKPNSTMDDNRAVFSKPPERSERAGGEERKFLVSELLPFIPPAISAQSGIPMELEVSIPMPEDGSSEVKLSTIYQACPDLFAAEITPLNDSEITLPVKLGGFSAEGQFASSPFTPGKAFGNSQSSPSEQAEPDQADNPFWSPVTKSESGDPDRSFSKPAAEEKRPELEPEEDMEKEPQTFGGFDEPYSPPPKASPPAEESDPVKSGFSGKPFGGEGSFTLFSNRDESDDDLEDETDPEPSTNWGSMFQAPSRKASEDEAPKSAEEVSNVVADETEEESPPSFQEDSAEAAPKVSADEAFLPAGFEMPSSDSAPEPVEKDIEEEPEFELPEEELEPEPEKVEAEKPESVEEKKPVEANKPSEDAEPVEEKEAPKPKQTLEWTSTAVAPSKPEKTEPAISEQPVQSVPEKPAPSVPEVSEERPVIAARTTHQEGEDDLSDVELRAIFSTSDRFTLAKLARKIVGLPGIAACALSGSGKVVQATKSEQNQLGSDAHDMVDAVRNIAKLTGMDSAKSFTMKTEFGVVSLFLEGDCCLSVNHDGGEFSPGIREKLIVIARSMHKLKD